MEQDEHLLREVSKGVVARCLKYASVSLDLIQNRRFIRTDCNENTTQCRITKTNSIVSRNVLFEAATLLKVHMTILNF